MSWRVKDLVSVRLEFVKLANDPDRNMRELCRRFEISPTIGYKWLKRFKEEAQEDSLKDLSRRPAKSPGKTATEVEELVVALRRKHPAWGARKLRRRLADQGHNKLPATSTITDILHRHQLINPEQSDAATPYQRFERTGPNQLWQIDFKGHFATTRHRCHPLCAVDDHSRYNVVLSACENQTQETVEKQLIAAFRRYGLPAQVLWDNGSPWGNGGQAEELTGLDAWLMRLGVRVYHGRPYHPQTQGKEERFLKAEVITRGGWRDCTHVQQAFDRWRPIYNTERPHEALGLATPISRYTASARSYPEELPSIQYDEGVDVRVVDASGWISYRGKEWKIGRAFVGQKIGIRSTAQDGILEAIYLTHVIKELDLRQNDKPRSSINPTDPA